MSQTSLRQVSHISRTKVSREGEDVFFTQ
ncbi:hypothetical protein AZE42_13931 [Rhizopogon vesiculosus]|uniref:Uncharacterized protein n=1 Tax=Rhizopogon vesiculosus TaxID=180088 RepID=A0A1J8QBY2_9AGAM|nr:hypothetical protein AZE42_13931 [Rhizopogon vesiculosus]